MAGVVLSDEQKFQLAVAITQGILSNSNTEVYDAEYDKYYKPSFDKNTLNYAVDNFEKLYSALLEDKYL